MRRNLIWTVAAAVSMVLLAMLVPMAVLLRSYALEDRVSRAALEVQATETVVAGQDEGAVAQYLDRINRGTGINTTVLYPGEDPGTDIGPDPGEDPQVVQTRLTGTARIDDVPGGVEFLVPVSRGGNTAAPSQTAVIRVVVAAPGFERELVRSWSVLLVLGLALLAGALVLADRLGRSFVTPIQSLADYAAQLGSARRPEPLAPSGPREVRELSTAMSRLVERIEVLLERERAGVADLSHRLRTPMTALRLRVEQLDAAEARRLGADLDELEAMVDHVVRESRRSDREGLVAGADAVLAVRERVAFWEPLAEDQGRRLTVSVELAEGPGTSVTSGTALVKASAEDLAATVDVLLDNVFSHTPDGTPTTVTVRSRAAGGVVVLVEDAGPGFPAGVDVLDRGTSGAGSSGLGLSIADKTATESGGGLSLGTSAAGGALVRVELGPPA